MARLSTSSFICAWIVSLEYIALTIHTAGGSRRYRCFLCSDLGYDADGAFLLTIFNSAGRALGLPNVVSFFFFAFSLSYTRKAMGVFVQLIARVLSETLLWMRSGAPRKGGPRERWCSASNVARHPLTETMQYYMPTQHLLRGVDGPGGSTSRQQCFRNKIDRACQK